jgi:hypothetical protein
MTRHSYTTAWGTTGEHEVIAKLGRPHQVVEGCGWYYRKPIAGCAREYLYYPPWTIVDEAWLIAFGDSGAVIHTAYFMSP